MEVSQPKYKAFFISGIVLVVLAVAFRSLLLLKLLLLIKDLSGIGLSDVKGFNLQYATGALFFLARAYGRFKKPRAQRRRGGGGLHC